MATQSATQSAQWTAASRLVRRSGFGSTGPAVDAALKVGASAYVRTMLAADPTRDPGALATPVPTFALIAPVGPAADKATRQARNKQRQQQLLALAGWWVQRMSSVQDPFGERLTFYWHDHFATAATKVRQAQALANQNATLRSGARGDFGALAQDMLVDAAMLYWLDGQKNTVKGANENLAREFMELFTLGHGDAYTETDVREGARALTGWRIATDLTTRLVPRLHDQGSKTVLGVTGNLDQAGYGAAVLAQPGGARYVATRMYNRLVSDDAPTTSNVDRLVAAYGPTHDLTALLSTLYTDPSFAAGANSMVVTPVEWLIGAVRALKIKPDAAMTARLVRMLKGLGQVPFYPPNVSGWPTGRAWLSTAAADLRLQYASVLAQAGDLSTVSDAAPGERIDAAGYLLGVGAWSARSLAALSPLREQPEQLVAVAVNTPEYLVH